MIYKTRMIVLALKETFTCLFVENSKYLYWLASVFTYFYDKDLYPIYLT